MCSLHSSLLELIESMKLLIAVKLVKIKQIIVPKKQKYKFIPLKNYLEAMKDIIKP